MQTNNSLPLLRTHLTLLENCVSKFASRPVFKVPQVLPGGANKVEQWTAITYAQFLRDVNNCARYWTQATQKEDLAPGSVVGVWLKGITYSDAVQIYGISRAGFIPQMFSMLLPNPVVIFELLHKGDAKVLMHDPSFAQKMTECPVPCYRIPELNEMKVDESVTLSPNQLYRADDIWMIFHTSGSTSGTPKLVPCSYAWLNANISKMHVICEPVDRNTVDTVTWMASMCHMGQFLLLIGCIQHGACIVQPTSIAFTSDELIDMIIRCGLNRIGQIATFLAIHLRNARLGIGSPELLSHLRQMTAVCYAGLPLPKEDEEWAYRQGIRLGTTFASTECGPLLWSIHDYDGTAALLRPIEGTSYKFIPITQPPPERGTGHFDASPTLLELVVPASAGDCPHSSLRSTAQEDYHTGDIFVEVSPGLYSSCGRNDDWIKTAFGLKCNTKAIEDIVHSACADLVSQCVVIGNGRPGPALFIELHTQSVGESVSSDKEKVKQEVLRRLGDFNSRLYLHERITSTNLILIVPHYSLPRTAKGNIRRKAVEMTYEEQLDEAYVASS